MAAQDGRGRRRFGGVPPSRSESRHTTSGRPCRTARERDLASGGVSGTGSERGPYLPATVAEAARRFGDRAAFVDPDGSPLTYAELHRRSDEVAAGMASAGVRERSV